MTDMPVYRAIAQRLTAHRNCIKAGNTEWRQRHAERLDAIVREYLPSGSGFDSGTALLAESKPECLKFRADFHHIDRNGTYTGWTHHVVTVRPSLVYGITLSVSGPARSGIKDYIADVFDTALRAPVPDPTVTA